MELFYWCVFGVLGVAIVALLGTQASDGSVVPSTGPNVANFVKLRNSYVFVYGLMMGEVR